MKTRILSGIVLVIIMASALVCGSWYLFGLNLMIALIGMFELYRVIHMEKTVMAYAGYIACILYYICIGAGRDEYLLLVLAAAVMAVIGSLCLCLSEVPHGKCVHYPFRTCLCGNAAFLHL